MISKILELPGGVYVHLVVLCNVPRAEYHQQFAYQLSLDCRVVFYLHTRFHIIVT